MVHTIQRGLDSLTEHYCAVCIALAQVILTLLGVGDARTVSILGLLLCAAGLAQRSAQADLQVLLPLIVYNLASMASSYMVYGSITEGYGPLQSIFPVLYLLTACLSKRELLLLRRLCVAWAGAAALFGVGQFVCRAVLQSRAGRLGGPLGNPNALGIFLVIGWFALLGCRPQGREAEGPAGLLANLEPALLSALALTLSMGSFAAMAAGILVLLAEKKRKAPWREALRYLCILLAKASLGVGTGLLLYLAASRTGAPWLCLPLLLYGAALAALWPKYERFLAAYPRMAALISALGGAVAVTVIAVRPSSFDTFAERLEMMGSALRYLTVNPLLGVGPYQWRLLDLNDGGTYFNTWHIHNALLHVGVELGWIAMTMVLAVVVRFYRKGPKAPAKAGFTAFCCHNMMDTSFFYLGITSLVLITMGKPRGKKLGGGWSRAVFGLFAGMFAWNLYCTMAA